MANLSRHESRQAAFQVLFALEKDPKSNNCLLYTSDAADEEDSVELGGTRSIKKKKKERQKKNKK